MGQSNNEEERKKNISWICFKQRGRGIVLGGTTCQPDASVPTKRDGAAKHCTLHHTFKWLLGVTQKPFFSCTGGAVLGTTKTLALLRAHHTSLTCLGRGTC